jgi:hypothetical protein
MRTKVPDYGAIVTRCTQSAADAAFSMCPLNQAPFVRHIALRKFLDFYVAVHYLGNRAINCVAPGVARRSPKEN